MERKSGIEFSVVFSPDLHSLREHTGLLAVAQARRGQVKPFPEVFNVCCEWQEPTPLTRSRCLAHLDWPGPCPGRVRNPRSDAVSVPHSQH